jgi:hypothetical protein
VIAAPVAIRSAVLLTSLAAGAAGALLRAAGEHGVGGAAEALLGAFEGVFTLAVAVAATAALGHALGLVLGLALHRGGHGVGAARPAPVRSGRGGR